MSKFLDKINAFFKAACWTGPSWLITLCVIHLLASALYVGIHWGGGGREYIQLDSNQDKAVMNLLAAYPDNTAIPTNLLRENANRDAKDSTKRRLRDSISVIRIKRTDMVERFLRTEYNCLLDSMRCGKPDKSQFNDMDSTLKELNTKDAGAYITVKKFLVKSYFWLYGPCLYLEALLWSFIGVITSLIYYVSLANQLALKKSQEDIGPFDTSEIPAQVAKMFYAPITTLIFVLGYNYFFGKADSVINISVNHGLIVFSFISGFYSGRLMKLLDSIKNLVLPVSSDGNIKKPGVTDIAVQLSLAEAVTSRADGPAIKEAAFTGTVITLESKDKPGTTITLDKPAGDKPSVFTGAKIPYGKYALRANYTYNIDPANLKLAATQDIEISESRNTFSVTLGIVEG